MPFIPHTSHDTAAMLARIGVKNLDDLFADIPPHMHPQSFSLPEGLSEADTVAMLEDMAQRNSQPRASFLGGGVYDHSIPKAVDALSSRGEFYTAYTPYQPEAAQGTLQAIFEYQTAVCRLLELDVANASVYDGGSAIFEAAMMAVRATQRDELVVDAAVNPLYRAMLATLTANLQIAITVVPHQQGCPDMEALTRAVSTKTAAVIVQNPAFMGSVHDYSALFATAREHGATSIIGVNPVMQAVLKTPGEMKADIAVAEGQSIGLPMAFGGPFLGIMACTKDMVRQMPGRIVGRTEDLEGKPGYVLTLQAREQHIRRAKATSNICSNQALCALRALMHLCLLGPVGLTRTAELSMLRAREAAAALTALPGVTLLHNKPYAHEFAVRLPIAAEIAVQKLAGQGILAGIPLGRWYPELSTALLVACTEKTTPRHIALFAKALGDIL